mmetsp:Transcript_21015/g.31108  ORF Transcript_21015/g.31108 Transcript_21015/m.31108 type:complete len:217 (-) Transcript_21015:508-1158(-)
MIAVHGTLYCIVGTGRDRFTRNIHHVPLCNPQQTSLNELPKFRTMDVMRHVHFHLSWNSGTFLHHSLHVHIHEYFRELLILHDGIHLILFFFAHITTSQRLFSLFLSHLFLLQNTICQRAYILLLHVIIGRVTLRLFVLFLFLLLLLILFLSQFCKVISQYLTHAIQKVLDIKMIFKLAHCLLGILLQCFQCCSIFGVCHTFHQYWITRNALEEIR